MNASMEAFANSIQDLSREELISLLVEMESARQQDAAIIAEFRRTSRDMHQEYSQMEMELKGARANWMIYEKSTPMSANEMLPCSSSSTAVGQKNFPDWSLTFRKIMRIPSLNLPFPLIQIPFQSILKGRNRMSVHPLDTLEEKLPDRKPVLWKNSRLSMSMNWMLKS